MQYAAKGLETPKGKRACNCNSVGCVSVDARETPDGAVDPPRH